MFATFIGLLPIKVNMQKIIIKFYLMYDEFLFLISHFHKVIIFNYSPSIKLVPIMCKIVNLLLFKENISFFFLLGKIKFNGNKKKNGKMNDKC